MMNILAKIRMTCSGISQSAKRISKLTGSREIRIILDMLWCLIWYAASPNNYELFAFYNLPPEKRETYVTYGVSRKMIKRFNDPKNINLFEDKIAFAQTFSDMYRRAYLDVSNMSFQNFEAFCQGKTKIICKPVAGSQGVDIRVYHLEDLTEVYRDIQKNYTKGFMVEEWIPQHEVLSNIYPDAVNCLRIITLLDGDTVHLLAGGVTFATETEIANGSQPSIIAPVDFETGVIHKPAAAFRKWSRKSADIREETAACSEMKVLIGVTVCEKSDLFESSRNIQCTFEKRKQSGKYPAQPSGRH